MNKLNSKNINIFLPIFFSANIVLTIIGGDLYRLGIEKGVHYPEFLQFVIAEIILLVVIVGYMAFLKINPVKSLPYKPLKPVDMLLSLIAGYMLVPLMLLISNISMFFARNYLQESSDTIYRMPFVQQIIIIAFVPAIVEELVFRGIIFHSYRECGFKKAAVMTGIIFGLTHMNINQLCYAVIMGMIFAYMVEATGSMWTSMLAHFACNTFSILVNKLSELLRVSELNSQPEQVEKVQEMANTVSVRVIDYVITYGILLCMTVGFTYMAYLCIKTIAKRNNRLNRADLKLLLKKQEKELYQENELHQEDITRQEATKNQEDGPRVWSVSSFLTVVFMLIFIIILEIMNNI